MSKQRISAIALAALLVAPPAIAQVPFQEDRRQVNPINEAGRIVGSDNPNLREDARQARNAVNVIGSVVDEFTGVNSRRYTGYLDLLFNLFRRRRRSPEQTPTQESGPGLIVEGNAEAADPDLNDTIGAAGIPIAERVSTAIASRVQQPDQAVSNIFAVDRVAALRGFQRFATINLNQETNDIQLGEEGQMLNAQVAAELDTLAEGANTVADEVQQTVATLDALRTGAKFGALNAAIAKTTAIEAQQTKLAQQQGNSALFQIENMMAKRNWQETVQRSANRIAVLKAAQSFGGAFKVLD